MKTRTHTRLALALVLSVAFLAPGAVAQAATKAHSKKKTTVRATPSPVKAEPGSADFNAATDLLNVQDAYDRARKFHSQKRDAEAVELLDEAIKKSNDALTTARDPRLRKTAGDLLARCGSLRLASVKARDNALGLPPAAPIVMTPAQRAADSTLAVATAPEPAPAPEIPLPEGDDSDTPDDATLALPAIDNDPNAIALESHPMVDKWLVYFTGRGRPTFERWLTRSGLYMDSMKKTLEQEGVPTDLVHLVFVESGFNPQARSYASAVGPWQFIRGTAKIFGLTVNSWVDERKDPQASTVAAARYLKHLYGLFNSWPLALASYNAGERTVINAIERQGTKDFWALRLPQQTRDYVPKFMAVLAISRDPERYGFDTVELEDPLAFDEVTIPGPVDLRFLATACGTDVDEIRRLNPQFLRNAAPGKDNLVSLRVPDGSGERLMASLEDGSLALPKVATPDDPAVLRHKVRRGESLKSLSLKYGVPAKQIARYNRLGKSSRLRVGRTLSIPMETGGSTRVSAATPSQAGDAATAGATAGATKTIKVKKGQTLSGIATAHGTSVATLRTMNGLSRRSVVKAGQSLKVPIES